MTDRLHAFEAIDNFRDYGDYATTAGRRVKPGRLLRSAHHARASEADLERLKVLDIGVVVDLRRPGERRDQPSRRPDGFSGQVIEGGVTLDQDTLFRAAIRLPAALTEGNYETRIFLTRGGSVVAQYETVIDVRKVGLERWLFTLSRENAFLYGLMSLAIAIAAGWGASAIFNVLRR